MIHFVRLNLNLNTLVYIKNRFYRIAINNVEHTQIAYQYFPLNSLSFKEHWSIKIKTTKDYMYTSSERIIQNG